jgi:hypothetical protein
MHSDRSGTCLKRIQIPYRFSEEIDCARLHARFCGGGSVDAVEREFDIMRKADGWFMSLVVACEPQQRCRNLEAGLDWGIGTFATLAYAPGAYDALENDQLLNAEAEVLKVEQRRLSTALRGKRSKWAKKSRQALAKRHRKVVNWRRNRIHGQAHWQAPFDRDRGLVDRKYDRLRPGDG